MNHEQPKKKYDWSLIKLQLDAKLNGLLQTLNFNDHLPWWPLFELFEYMSKDTRQCLEYGLKNGDVQCMYYLAWNSDQISKFKQLIALKHPKAHLGLAHYSENYEDAYNLFVDAGKNYIAEGYYQAALLIVNGFKTDVSLEEAATLFEKAGDLGDNG